MKAEQVADLNTLFDVDYRTIVLDRITTQKQNKLYSFSIADQGPGIEEDEIDQIFEKFYRGKSERHRVQGTGMCLPIAKAIVEARGGSICHQLFGPRFRVHIHFAGRTPMRAYLPQGSLGGLVDLSRAA